MPDSDHELGLENIRLTSGCLQMGHDLGAALKSEIQRLAGGQPADQVSARSTNSPACVWRPTACNWVGEILNPHLQRHFLELARQLTATAESAAVPAFAPSV